MWGFQSRSSTRLSDTQCLLMVPDENCQQRRNSSNLSKQNLDQRLSLDCPPTSTFQVRLSSHCPKRWSVLSHDYISIWDIQHHKNYVDCWLTKATFQTWFIKQFGIYDAPLAKDWNHHKNQGLQQCLHWQWDSSTRSCRQTYATAVLLQPPPSWFWA